jgi:nicotinamidase-related amidase
MNTALVIVDVQHDFLPGGALAVPNGDRIIPAIKRLAAQADLVVASQDWHPSFHMSFEPDGGTWPVHCVQNTHGAELHPEIAHLAERTVQKGTDPESEQYSAADNTPLIGMLRASDCKNVIVSGLATDYCVRATVMDLLDAGFSVTVHRDSVAGVDVAEGDSERAFREMTDAGAVVV